MAEDSVELGGSGAAATVGVKTIEPSLGVCAAGDTAA